MKRLLITGGSGYVGGWATRIARADWNVAATYATNPGSAAGVEWSRLDVRDAAAVGSLVEELRPAAIVHTAAINPGQGDDFVGVNVTGTANVARAAAATGARLIHVSTDVLFDGRKGSYVEADPPAPLNEYARSKADAETAVARSGAEAVIARTSLVYGWRPTTSRAAQWMIDKVAAGESLRLWADELRCPIWVESLAAALVELAGHDYTGVLHVAGAQSLTRYEFGIALLDFYGVDSSGVMSAASPPDAPRPLDATMDCSLARRILHTPLPGVGEVLARGDAIR